MNKDKLLKEVNDYNESLAGATTDFKSLCRMILKSLELKDKGLKSSDLD